MKRFFVALGFCLMAVLAFGQRTDITKVFVGGRYYLYSPTLNIMKPLESLPTKTIIYPDDPGKSEVRVNLRSLRRQIRPPVLYGPQPYYQAHNVTYEFRWKLFDDEPECVKEDTETDSEEVD